MKRGRSNGSWLVTPSRSTLRTSSEEADDSGRKNQAMLSAVPGVRSRILQVTTASSCPVVSDNVALVESNLSFVTGKGEEFHVSHYYPMTYNVSHGCNGGNP